MGKFSSSCGRSINCIAWAVEHTSVVVLNASMMIGVGILVGNAALSVFDKVRLLIVELDQANSIEEVDLINW